MKIHTRPRGHLYGLIVWSLVPLVLFACVVPSLLAPEDTQPPPATTSLPPKANLVPTRNSTSLRKVTHVPTQNATATLDIATPEMTDTPVIPTPTLSIPVREGLLDELVWRLEAIAPREETDGFRQPSAVAITDFNSLVGKLLENRFEEAAALAARYDYKLFLLHDYPPTGTEYIVLQEGEPIQRGWGLYVLDLQACHTAGRMLIIEAPHILADEGTPQIALDIFRELDACALLIAGTHRSANRDGSADVAHNPETIFQSIQNSLAGPAGSATLVLQIHGFSARKHPGYPSVIIGGTSGNVTEWTVMLAQLTQALAQQGIESGLCDGIKWTDLCGETNMQAINLLEGSFIHLEMDEELRDAPGKLIAGLVETFRLEP